MKAHKFRSGSTGLKLEAGVLTPGCRGGSPSLEGDEFAAKSPAWNNDGTSMPLSKSLCTEETFQTLVTSLFDAAWNPEEWPSFLDSFGNLVGSVCTTLYCENAKSEKGSLSLSLDISPRDQHFYKSFSHRKAHKQNLFSDEGRLSGYIVRPGQEVIAIDFYDDWLLGALILRQESVKANLVCLRPAKVGPFSEPECALLHRLLPYLKRSLLLHLRLRGMKVMHDAVSQLLNHLTMGVLVVDCKGHILSQNRHANTILQQRDGIWASGDELRTARREELKQLLSHIQSVAPCAVPSSNPAVRAMQISRNSGRSSYSILISPLTTDAQLTQDECMIAIFVYDPAEEICPPEQTLRDLYGLTPAEVRLVTLLLKGKTLEEIAASLEISMSTIRTQIRSVFAKTNTNRQAELIRLLLRSPCAL